jgi:hypothetical protein
MFVLRPAIDHPLNSRARTVYVSRKSKGKFVSNKTKKNPWPYSLSELYEPSDCPLSAKLVLTFADRGFRVVSVTDSYGRILGFLDRSRYFFLQVAPQLYTRG